MKKNCKGEVINADEIPAKRRQTTKQVVKQDEIQTNVKNYTHDIPDNMKEEICRMIARQGLKLKEKEDNFKKLTQQIA